MQSLDCTEEVVLRSQPLESDSAQESPVHVPKTLGALFEQYQQNLLKNERHRDLAFLRTTTARHLVPALTGPCSTRAKMTNDEIKAAFEFLHQQPASRLEDLLEDFKEYLNRQEALAPKTKQLARGAIRKWMKWAAEEGFIQEPQPPSPPRIYRFKNARKAGPYREEIRLLHGPRGRLTRNALGIFESDYVPAEQQHVIPGSPESWKSWRAKVLLDPDVKLAVYLANPTLDAEIRAFIKFLKNRMDLRTVTVEKDVNTLLRFLGWLHRKQGIPLANLRLTTVIPFVKLKFKTSDFRDAAGAINREAFREAKRAAREDLEAVTDDVKQEIEHFLAQATLSPAAAVGYITGVINLAKYVYQDETEIFSSDRSGFKDIFLVESLRGLRNSYAIKPESKKTVIPRSTRLVSWLSILDVVEKLRVEAELLHRFQARRDRPLAPGQPGVSRVKRTDHAIAVSFQKFLILAIMTALPPGRPRDYRELELGRTFIQGGYQNGVFLLKEDMKDPTQAQWWIHLMPEDYRTGKFYGEWEGELPNIRFANGKTLYQYIDEWLTLWRPVFQPKHQCLFTQHNGKVLSANNFANKVQTMIFRFTGVRVNPHSLRHAYVTYVRANSATEEQLEGTAAAMRHSRKTQSKIYNQLDLQDKLAPAKELVQQIAESFYSDYEAV